MELLADTFGVMVYQEDVIKVVHELGGLTLGEADILRRAMSGKAGGREAMAGLTDRFFAGCRARGVPEPVIGELWRQIETFARFSFCKGHSAAFAVLSYQVAYLKAHHPAEFMASVLANGGGFYAAAAYIQECRRLGLRVLRPDVNESEVEYWGKTGERERSKSFSTTDCTDFTDFEIRKKESVKSVQSVVKKSSYFSSPGWVRVGFTAIKNFPLDLARRIVRVRSDGAFEGFEDFLRRTRAGPEATESLIRVGAFDCFGVPRERLCLEMDLYFRKHATDGDMADCGLMIAEKKDGPQIAPISQIENTNHDGLSDSISSAKSAQSAVPFFSSKIQNRKSTIAERVEAEIELLGYGVSAHPLELLPEEVWRGTVAARDMHRHVGRRVTMIGWPIAAKLVRTRNSQAGRPSHFMKFLSLEDLTDTFEVTLFPCAYGRFAPLTLGVGPFRVRGKIENEQGALSLVADWMEIV